MSPDRRDELLERDWSAAWEALPEAPALVARPKTAQITLRLPSSMLTRIKRVAAERSLAYHPLVRSWLLDALREGVVPAGELPTEPQVEQLNVKLDQDLLDAVKTRAHELGRPYHRLVREWVDAALVAEEKRLGLAEALAARPGIKDLMVLLLHAADARSHDAVRGITRLQKLLFVLEETVGAQGAGFYAYNYGPFNEGVNDAVQALRLAGFLKGTEEAAPAGPPSFAEMMATAVDRAGPRSDSQVEEFELSDQGHKAAERLRQSSRAYEELFVRIQDLRAQWDTPDLVERVYETWPEYAKESLIKDEVAARRARRRSRR
jgi:predicted DNA binding CopG/RHH family protein